MAEMQPGESNVTPNATPGATKAGKTAESVRQKGHDLAGSARSGVESVSETIDTVSDYAQRAQDLIATAERRLDEFIDQAETMFTKGAKYTGTARNWLDSNKQYKDKVESLVSKYHQYSDKLRSRMQQGGESEGPTLGERGQEAIESAKSAGQAKASQYAQRAKSGLMSTGRYVRENPTETLLVGAAVGVLIGTAIKHLSAEETYETLPSTGYTEGGTPYGSV